MSLPRVRRGGARAPTLGCVKASDAGRDLLAAAVLGAVVLACAVDALAGGGLLQRDVVLLALALAAGVVGAISQGVRAMTGLLTLCALVLALANQVIARDEYPLWNDVVFFSVLLGAPALIGRAVAERARQIREVTVRTDQLRRQRADEQRTARLEEQSRVEAGVQQAVMQRMGAIALQAAGAERAATTDPARAHEALVVVERSARAALDELREVLGSLRLPEPEPAPTEPATLVVVRARVGPLDVAVGLFGLAIAAEALTSSLSRGPAWANVATALGMTVPLVWRRRWPLTALTVCMSAVVLMAGLLTPPDALVTPLAPMLVAAFAITANATRRRRLAGVGLLGAVAVAMTWLPGAGDGAVPVSLAMAAAAAAGWVWSARNRRVAQLSALEDQLRSGEQAAVRLAAAERRQELARELHDVVAHAMTVVCLHSAGARQAGPDRAAAAARTMAEVTRDAMGQLRGALDELEADGSTTRFDPTGLVATARASGTSVALDVRGEPRPVQRAVAWAAERTLQEALTNAARHAPGAQVDVTVVWESDALVVDVQDRPSTTRAAPEAIGSGSGLIGLRERARSRGGTLEAGPNELGFGVRARLPILGGSS